jgi:hypothetical protein
MGTSKAAIGAVGKRTFRPTDWRGKMARFPVATLDGSQTGLSRKNDKFTNFKFGIRTFEDSLVIMV